MKPLTLEQRCELDLILKSDALSRPKAEYSVFFHYTHREAADKIIDGKTFNFRFTRADRFSDKTEGRLIFSLFGEVLNQLCLEGRLTQSDVNVLKKIEMDSVAPPWILCATMNGNSQYMKNTYAEGDGKIIAFQSTAFNDLTSALDLPEQMCRVRLYEIAYTPEKIREYLTQAVLLYAEKFGSNSRGSSPQKLCESMRWELEDMRYLLKGQKYQKEEEIRLIVYPNTSFQKWENKSGLCLYRDPIDKNLYLRMESVYYFGVFDSPNRYLQKALNKFFLTSDEIREALRKS